MCSYVWAASLVVCASECRAKAVPSTAAWGCTGMRLCRSCLGACPASPILTNPAQLAPQLDLTLGAVLHTFGAAGFWWWLGRMCRYGQCGVATWQHLQLCGSQNRG